MHVTLLKLKSCTVFFQISSAPGKLTKQLLKFSYLLKLLIIEKNSELASIDLSSIITYYVMIA